MNLTKRRQNIYRVFGMTAIISILSVFSFAALAQAAQLASPPLVVSDSEMLCCLISNISLIGRDVTIEIVRKNGSVVHTGEKFISARETVESCAGGEEEFPDSMGWCLFYVRGDSTAVRSTATVCNSSGPVLYDYDCQTAVEASSFPNFFGITRRPLFPWLIPQEQGD